MEQRIAADARQPREIRLYLIAPDTVEPELAEALDAALRVGDVAAVLFPAEFEGRGALISAAQKAEAAVLTSPESQEPGIDGVHVDGDETKFQTLRRAMPDAIVGIGGVSRRHDGMAAGEAGADYVAIGRLTDGAQPLDMGTRRELLEWWQAMMTVPCVARADTEAEALKLAEAGADFIAFAPSLWTTGAGAGTVERLRQRFEDIARAEVAAVVKAEAAAE